MPSSAVEGLTRLVDQLHHRHLPLPLPLPARSRGTRLNHGSRQGYRGGARIRHRRDLRRPNRHSGIYRWYRDRTQQDRRCNRQDPRVRSCASAFRKPKLTRSSRSVDISLPSLDVPELSALENVTLPDTLVNALTSLNSSIPTLSEFRSTLDDLISKPIESLRANINGTLSNSTIDVELLPIPPKQTVELCTNLDTSWIDDVGSDLGKFVKVAIGLVVLVMALFIIANALWEKWRYRVFLGGVEAAREAWLNDLLSAASSVAHDAKSQTAHETLSTTNLLSFLNASSHPTLFRHVSRLASFLRLSTSSSRADLIWFLSYIAHPPAWAFLALGLVGLIVVQIQLAILDGPIRRMVRRRAEDGAGQFSSSVMGALNEKMRNASESWANGTNQVILGLQDDVNNNLVRLAF